MEFNTPRLYLLGDKELSWICVKPLSRTKFGLEFRLPMAIGPDSELETDHPTEHYAAECPALDLGSQGSDHEDAKEMLCDAIRWFVCSCLECNSLDQTLRGYGFSPVEADLEPPPSVPETRAWARTVPVQLSNQEIALNA